MENIRKRITCAILAVFIFVMTITGNTGISFFDNAFLEDVYAASGRITLSRTLSRLGISEIGRSEGEGLWTIRVSGKKVFCLNSGKALHTNDTAKGKTSDAENYKNQSLAKVTTYYFGEKDESGGNKLFALCQAYAWAAGKGKNKKTAMVQAAKYVGATENYAKKIYNEIEKTVPYGKVTYYTIGGCKKSASGSSHQHLIGWSYKPPLVETDEVYRTYSAPADETINLTINKQDSETGRNIDSATFNIYRDNVYVGSAATQNGVATFSYSTSYYQELENTDPYIYVKNWSSLNSAKQEEMKAKGYYSCEAYAAAAAINDLKPRVEALLDSMKLAPHEWKVVEVSAPKNHNLSSNREIIQYEQGYNNALYFNFVNSPVKMTLNLTKKADGDYGTEATLRGAVYGLYADETIYMTDNATVAYTKGNLVTTMTTDAAGNASLTNLLPGRYTVKEIQASKGFNLDPTVYSVDLTYGDGNTSTTRSLTVTEKRVMGKIDIKKTWDNEEKPYEYVTEKQLKADYKKGTCEHHTDADHDDTCGYVEAKAAQPCKHIHTDDCYKDVTVCLHEHDESCYSDGILPAEGEDKEADACTHVCTKENGCITKSLVNCLHVHDADCYSDGILPAEGEDKEADACTHVCTEENGCITKTLDCKHVHDDTCGYADEVEGHDCEYFCDICAYEDVIVKKTIPITDSFELYDSKNNLVDTIVIGADGKGQSKDIPYGTYMLRQKTTTKGFAKAASCLIKIDENNQKGTVRYPEKVELDDMLDEAGFMLTKFKSISDDETGTYKKEPEGGAKFEIYAPNGAFVKTITTGSNGVAYSGNLETYGFGQYTVRQISGDSDYMLLADQKINVAQKKIYFAEYENTYCGSKLRIKKNKHKTATEPEKDAEFAILDASLITETKEELVAMATAEERANYLIDLQNNNPDAVIAIMSTGSDGKAVDLFDNWKYADHPQGFIVYQTNGEQGYTLTDPAYSGDLTMTVENNIHVFSFEATDEWDDWANITLTKMMTTSATDTAFEEGAEFAIRDSQDNVVQTKKTDANGTVRFEQLDYGTYRIEQVSGDVRHETTNPVTVTLTRYDKHQDVAATAAPIVDKEKEVTFELTKKSAETGILLDGARYELYRVTEDESGRHEEFISTLVSGSMTQKDASGKDVPVKGKASYNLMYGSYLVKEVYPADGYTVDDTEYTFTLDMNSVTYDSKGNGVYSIEVKDEPIKGKVSLNKKGNVVTAYDDNTHVFNTKKTSIEGAVYGLYAREDIVKDNGDLVWAAGSLVDKKTTDENGDIVFTTTDRNGNVTDEFYLGSYYVKEISVPAGFALDKEEYDVYLTWDNKTNQFNDIRSDSVVEEEEDPIGNNSPDPNKDKYVLDVGSKVNNIIKNATTVTFTWEKAPAGTTTRSIASDGGNGVVYWNSGTNYYISTQLAGQVIYFNAISDHMFAGCTALTDIKFKNVDTSKTVDMSYMFYRCSALTSLDLSSFNTKNVEDMSYMFEFCSAVTTIYVNDQKLTTDQVFDEDIPSRIVAIPKGEIMIGHTYVADDFLYYMYYQNGKSEPIYPTDAEAVVNPHVADEAGNKTVQITFISNQQYGEFGTIETDVVVIDPRDIILDLTWASPEVNLSLTDEPQQIAIQFIKADANDSTNAMLEGAEFTLYAACDIVNSDGQVILKKDDVIDTQISGGPTFTCVQFYSLPSSVYKKNPSDPYMYYIKETKAPDGYYGNDKVIYCNGKATNQDKQEFIYAYTGLEDTDDVKEFITDANYLYKNQKVPYVILKKEWLPDIPSARPDKLAVTVTLPDGTKKNYTLKAEDDWTLITDIDANVFNGKTTSQMTGYFKENLTTDKYEESGSTWDKNTNTYTFRNKYKNPIASTVTKVWSDGNDTEHIRPSTVKMELYRNDVYQKTITLPKANGSWSHTEDRLDATDANGVPYVYEWREVLEGVVSGDSATGYMPISNKVSTADGEETIITNYHEINTIDKSIRKVWNDSDDKQQIRPESVDVQLLADGVPVKMVKTVDGYACAEDGGRNAVDTITLNADNIWKTTVTDLPVSGDNGDITYNWKEVLNDATWITGESVIGYAPEYTQDPNDLNGTLLTNRHVYNTGSSVKVNKKVLKDNLSFFVEQPTFTFTITGKDVYGRDYSSTKDITFTEADLANVDANGYITKSVTFENVPYGKYTVTEAGMEGIYKQVTLTPDTANTSVTDEGTAFNVQVGPTLEEAKQQAGVSTTAAGGE